MVVIGASLMGGVFGVMVALPWVKWSSTWPQAMAKILITSFAGTWVTLGMVHLLGIVGLLVVLVVASGAPALAPAYGALAGGPREPAPLEPVPVPSQEHASVDGTAGATVAAIVDIADASLVVPDLMTVADLCDAWRSSYVALQRATTAESRMRIVLVRSLYLDELERHSGPAVAAWLRSGARAASDPARFLRPPASPACE